MHKYDTLVEVDYVFFRLKAATSARVAVITKNELKETNTWYAQGGIVGVMDLNQDSSKNIFKTHCRSRVM